MSRMLDGTAVTRDREWGEFPDYTGWVGLNGRDGTVEGAIMRSKHIRVPQKGILGESGAEIIAAQPSSLNPGLVILTIRMIPR